MTFPSYPEYKDSGVEWLRDVPKHWEAWKISRAFGKIGSGTTPTSSESKWYQDGEIPWLTTGELRESLITDTSKKITLEALQNFSALQIHPKGSLAIAMYGATIGRLGILGVDATTNQACCVLSHPHKISIKFFYYWFQAFKQIIIDRFAYGGGQPNINQEIIASLRVAAPELEEQGQIVQFLDYETSKIDALIAEQEKLIELLNEKRQSIISNAVCRGLDPNVPMKDSGVEWLGMVPEHWSVKALKHIVSIPITDGPHETPEFIDEGVPFVSAEAVSSGVVDFAKIRGFISRESHEKYSLKYAPKRGDIFMVKSGATTGVCAIVETDDEFNIWSPLAVVRCIDDIEPHFVLNYMRSLNFQEAIALNWNFGTQQNIGMGVIENLMLPVPPHHEQRDILKMLRGFLNESNALISEASKGITLLTERRSALISAAVCGHIDVRNFHGN